MEERLEDLLLIKNFLKLFDVYYEKIPYYSTIDLTNNGIIDLYQGNIKVGNLILKDDKYKINFNLDDISLKASSQIEENNGRRFLTLNYSLIKNNDKIKGKYTINKFVNNNKKDLVVKHKLWVFNNYKKTKFYRFYTIKNETYLNDLITDEYINFDNGAISHKLNKKFSRVRYDYNDKLLDYLCCYFDLDNEPLTITGGYKLFNDANKNEFDKVIENYKIRMDELSPRYIKFVKEQKDALEYFYDDLFDRIVDNSLTSLTDLEKEYIFGKKENNCYKLKR